MLRAETLCTSSLSAQQQLLTAQPALIAPFSTLLLLLYISKPQNSYACHFSFILQNKTKFLHLAFKALPKLAIEQKPLAAGGKMELAFLTKV